MMPPRQRNPFQGPPMGGGRMPGMRGQPNFPNQMGRGGGPGKGSGGGLLSKILGGGRNAATTTATQGARSAATSGGGILKTLTNPSSINGFLANSQKFLNTASQLGPMINQYGPMVRNIPAMWKLYRGLKSTGSSSEETTTPKGNNDTEKTNSPANTSVKKKQPQKSISTEEVIDDFDIEAGSEPVKGSSKPKLYV